MELTHFKFKLLCAIVLAMNDNAYLKCIDPKCGLEYAITSGVLECEKGHILDVKYNKIP